MQDVLLSAFQRFERIRKKDELLHYLIRAARNRAVSIRRSDGRQERIREQLAARLKDRGTSAEMLVDDGILHGASAKLPSPQREAMMLFGVSGLSMAEIAAVLGFNENAVKTRVSRARDDLRTSLHGRARPLQTGLLNTLTNVMP